MGSVKNCKLSLDQLSTVKVALMGDCATQLLATAIRGYGAEGNIERIAADKNYITIYFTLRDKFGDHGLISVVILEGEIRESYLLIFG